MKQLFLKLQPGEECTCSGKDDCYYRHFTHEEINAFRNYYWTTCDSEDKKVMSIMP